MRDPLNNFNWDNLYDSYDKRCKGFDSDSNYLIKQDFRVSTDRELYYTLIKSVKSEITMRGTLSFETYLGILYWKLYSQEQSTICKNAYSKEKSSIENGLLKLKDVLPPVFTRNIDEIKSLIINISRAWLYGMKTDTSLPVRSTLLHFIYPDIVPIFDRMVLSAVGITERNANQKIEIFTEYVLFNWSLCERYEDKIMNFKSETPVRVIDMALWVVR